MKRSLTSLGMVLLLLLGLAQSAMAGTSLGARHALRFSSGHALLLQQAQYLNDFVPPPRIRRLPPAMRMRPRPSRPPRLRPPSRPRRAYAPPLPRRTRTPGRRAAVTVRPSEALRLAQRRWPDSVGLSVRLLGDDPPVYVVKLRTRSRVVRVLVDARSGRVMQ